MRRGCSARRRERRPSRWPCSRSGSGPTNGWRPTRIYGSGAAGGLGAALASLGAELVPGADAVLDLVGFDPRPYDLVVTGEGAVDGTTWEGKAPSAVARRCAGAGVPCVVFGGRVIGTVPGTDLPQTELVGLSGDPSRAEADLVELGATLGRRLQALGGA
jgi:hypothetical protein